MIAWWRQHGLVVYLVGSLLIGLVSIVELSLDLGQPFPGFVDFYDPSENSWGMVEVTPTWWPGRVNQAILFNDSLLAVNGKPYNANVRQVYAAAYHAGARQVTLTLGRHGTIVTQEVPLVLFTFRHLLDLKAAQYVLGGCFWLLAVAVYRAQPHAPLNRAFAILFAQGALSMLALPGTVFRHSTGLDRLIMFVGFPLTVSTVWAQLVRFTTLFPTPAWQGASRLHRGLRQWVTPGAYGIAATMAISEGLAFLLWWYAGWSPLVGWLGWSIKGVRYGSALVATMLVLRCLWEIRPGVPAHQRRRMLVVFGGLMLAVPYTAVLLIPGIIDLFPSRLDLRFLMLGLPIAFAAIILRYRTFLSGRTGFVLVTEIAVSAILASFASAFLTDPGDANILPPFVPIFIATFIASQIWSWLTSSQGWLWSLLYREDRTHRSVKAFGQGVAQSFTSTQLPSAIVNALVQQFRTDVAVLYQYHEPQLILTGYAGDWQPPDHLEAPLSQLVELDRPVVIGHDAQRLPAGLEKLRASGRIEVAAPLLGPDRPLGLLGIGRREGEEIFDVRDMDAVEIIAQQCALFLQAAEQLEALRRVPLEIEQAQEQERRRIAVDLHDNIQQFLAGLQFPLEMSRKLRATDPAKVDAYLSQMIRDVDRSAKILRQISYNLMPRDLQKGLREPLQSLVEEYRARCQLNIGLIVPDELDQGLGLDERHAIRSVVRQALDNIVAHAQATQVDIQFVRGTGRVEFTIADDGRGFSEADRQRAQANKRLGLVSMQARIAAMRGELSVESEQGLGTRVMGWVPFL